jgi:transcriptional regulator with XRE-family HTH domain
MTKKDFGKEYQEEAQALDGLIKAYNAGKPSGQKISGARVAEDLGITASGFSHYLRGVNPLNLNVAIRVGKIFGFPISSFSPRLAKEMEMLIEMADLEVCPPLPTGVSRHWQAMNEKLLLLPCTPIPALPELILSIEADRKALQRAAWQNPKNEPK